MPLYGHMVDASLAVLGNRAQIGIAASKASTTAKAVNVTGLAPS
jgi:hypothetical protein